MLLTACEEAPTKTPPEVTPPQISTPVKPAPKQVIPDDKYSEMTAQFITLASYVGALHHCRVEKLYTSQIVEDSYYRMRGIMRSMMATGEPQLEAMGQITYAAYQRAFEQGVTLVTTIVAEGDNAGKFKVVTEAVDTEGKCKAVEGTLTEARKRGGMLDVQPDRGGLKGDPT